MLLAKRQIEIAFQAAQQEIEFLRQRTSEGIRRTQVAEKQAGEKYGEKITVRKAEQ